MTAPTDLPVHYFEAGDGQRLAFRALGDGRPVILLHGYFSSAYVNWVKYGHAARLADRNRTVVMPDLRAHGDSAKPHEASAYPSDVLTEDVAALLEHLGLGDGEYDVGGYSLGARTVIRMLALGIRPGRAVVAGMGLEGMTDTDRGSDLFRRVLTRYGTFRHGDPEFMSQAFLKTMRGDPEALLGLLDTSVDTPVEVLGGLDIPALVIMGDLDDDHGDGRALAETLPDATYATVPGSHMSAVTRPELGDTFAEFLR